MSLRFHRAIGVGKFFRAHLTKTGIGGGMGGSGAGGLGGAGGTGGSMGGNGSRVETDGSAMASSWSRRWAAPPSCGIDVILCMFRSRGFPCSGAASRRRSSLAPDRTTRRRRPGWPGAIRSPRANLFSPTRGWRNAPLGKGSCVGGTAPGTRQRRRRSELAAELAKHPLGTLPRDGAIHPLRPSCLRPDWGRGSMHRRQVAMRRSGWQHVRCAATTTTRCSR